MTINEYIDDYKLNKDNIILIDVREKEEYISGKIEGAINIPLSNIISFLNLYPNKDAIYYIHCRSGFRSSKAVSYLKEFGYKNVINIGGIIDYDGELIK